MKRALFSAVLGATVSLLPSYGQGGDLAGASSQGLALRVDTVTGQASRVSGVGLEGYRSVGPLAFTPAGTLFGVDYDTLELMTIDVATRRGAPVGGIGFSAIQYLTFHAPSSNLYAIEDVVGPGISDRLIRIDPSTGQGTLVGNLGSSYSYVKGLAFDQSTGKLFATNTNQLIMVNRLTGAGSPVGPTGYTFVSSLAVHPVSRVLYGIDQQGDQLLTINKTTGQATPVGFLGFMDVRGIAFDPTGILYGMDANLGMFLRISTLAEPGQPLGTKLGPLGYSSIKGLAYVPSEGALYATDTRNDKLLRMNPLTAQASVIGDLKRDFNAQPFPGETIYEMQSLAFRPGGQGGPAALYGADAFRDILYSINRTTGQATETGFLLLENSQGGGPLSGVKALAWDTHLRTLFAGDKTGGTFGPNDEQHSFPRLVRWNQSTNRWTDLGMIGGLIQVDMDDPESLIPEYSDINGMVYVPRFRFFAASAVRYDGSQKLIAIQKETAAVSYVSPFGVEDICGLAHDPLSGGFEGVASPRYTASNLYLVAELTGQTTTIGSLGFNAVEGLAYDSHAQALFGSTIMNAGNPIPSLIRINPQTGQGTTVGVLANSTDETIVYTAIAGLAFDQAGTGTLYGTDTVRDQLVRIDRSTGRVTPIGSLGTSDIQGLAFDPNTGRLYGVDAYTDRLIRINRTTGIKEWQAANPLGFPKIHGLEFDVNTSTLYGTDAETLQLIRIHTSTGVGTAVGSTGYKVDGLALTP